MCLAHWKWGDEQMKTSNVSLTISAEEPTRIPRGHDDFILMVRTPEGELMTNRVRSLIREYGNRVNIPASLMLEVLEDRRKKASELKAVNRELCAYSEVCSEAVGLLLELRDAADAISNGLIEAPVDNAAAHVTAEIERVNTLLEIVDDFLDEALEKDDDQ